MVIWKVDSSLSQWKPDVAFSPSFWRLRVGHNYYYRYFKRACAPKRWTKQPAKPLRSTSNDDTEPYSSEEEEGKEIDAINDFAFEHQQNSQCVGSHPLCQQECWRPICRGCFVRYHQVDKRAAFFLCGSALNDDNLIHTGQCRFERETTVANEPEMMRCQNKPVPTCNGYCYLHRETEVINIPQEVIASSLMQEPVMRTMPAAILDLMAQFAQC